MPGSIYVIRPVVNTYIGLLLPIPDVDVGVMTLHFSFNE